MNVRELALDIFLEMEKTGGYGSSLIRKALDKYDYEDAKEKAFFKRLSEGVLERRITLDWAIDCCSGIPVKKMKPLIRNLLRLSAYQILYMEAIPDAAACNEAVKLAKKRGFSSLSGFVNGVLRKLAGNKENLPMPNEEKEPVKSLSVRYSLPEWLIQLWTVQYGREMVKKLGEGIGQRRPVIIRLKRTLSQEQRADVLDRIRKRGVLAKMHPLYPDACVLENCEGVLSLPGFAEGLFYVQDVSSMLAVEAAGIMPGMKVLDLCSAPGGKAILAYEKLEPLQSGYGAAAGSAAGRGGREEAATAKESRSHTGTVRAGDLSEAKTDKIRENAARMGCEDMEIFVWDARNHMEELDGWADVLLADLPCSGLGVIGRKKDIRYRIRPEDLRALCVLQKEILAASWQYVKPGGILLYSTCTVNKTENEETVRYVTENYPFELEKLDPYLPACLHNAQTKSGMLQLFPGEYDTDGFFLARLRRRADCAFAHG